MVSRRLESSTRPVLLLICGSARHFVHSGTYTLLQFIDAQNWWIISDSVAADVSDNLEADINRILVFLTDCVNFNSNKLAILSLDSSPQPLHHTIRCLFCSNQRSAVVSDTVS